MAILDNTLVQASLVIFAIYIVLELLKQQKKEPFTTAQPAAIPVESNVSVPNEPPRLVPSGMPVPAETTSETAPAPLTTVQGELYAMAPPPPEGQAEDSPFTAEAVDYDQVFNRDQDLQPSDLIPKTSQESLYSNLKPDPSMQGNLLINGYQLGIETDAGKRRWIADPRKVLDVDYQEVSPWNNPTTFVDVNRKSISDI